jgi:hypothetical protein
MAIRSWFGFASAVSLAFATVAIGCSEEDDGGDEQSTLPVFGLGGTGGTTSNPVGAAGTGGTAPVNAGQGGTAAVANGGTGGAPAGANGGTGGSPATGAGGTGGAGGSAGLGGTGGNTNTGAGGTGLGGTGGAPGAGGTGTGAGGTATTPPTGDAVSFQQDVWPIFMQRCAPCHTTGRSGGQSVGSATLATALADARRVGEELATRLDGGGMPPGCNTAGTAPCIPLNELQIVEDWLDDGSQP